MSSVLNITVTYFSNKLLFDTENHDKIKNALSDYILDKPIESFGPTYCLSTHVSFTTYDEIIDDIISCVDEGYMTITIICPEFGFNDQIITIDGKALFHRHFDCDKPATNILQF